MIHYIWAVLVLAWLVILCRAVTRPYLPEQMPVGQVLRFLILTAALVAISVALASGDYVTVGLAAVTGVTVVAVEAVTRRKQKIHTWRRLYERIQP